VWWHVAGVAIIFLAFMFVGDKQPTIGFGGLFDAQAGELAGWSGKGFVVIWMFGLGLLLAQYTITGFDASAHVSEETVGARTEAPKAIVRAIYVSAIAAFFLNMAMTQALPKDADAYGGIAYGGEGEAFLVNAAPRLISSTFGSGMAKFLVLISVVAQFFCGMASVTANSRMIYAFSRDGGLPGSRFWHRINPRTRTPTNSIWLGVVLSAIVGLISIYQKAGYSTAFFALTGICVIGLYISYGIPIYLRLTNPDFQQGPWNLKGYSRLVGWTGLAWIGLITILFFGPVFRPFWPPFGKTDGVYHQNNFNWTGPLIILSFVGVALYWVLSGRRWFTGPKVQGTPEELRAIERELDALEHGGVLPAPAGVD